MMKTMKNIVIKIIIVLSLFSSNVWAGTTDDLIQAGTIVPVQKKKVRLVSEEVQISADCKVSATFILENLSNDAFTMKVGLPFRAPGPENINVIVQEQLVEVSKRIMGGKNEIAIKDKDSGNVYEMFVWNIHFAPNAKKIVKLAYTAQWGSILAEETAMHFIYVAKTGALWTGNIEKADFYIKLDKDAEVMLNNKKNDLKLVVKPKNYKISNNLLEWHFKNWKPNENIAIAVMREDRKLKDIFETIVKYSENILITDETDNAVSQEALQRISEYFRNKVYDGDRRNYDQEDIKKWSGLQTPSIDDTVIHRLYVKALRNEIYARHGRFFTNEEIDKIFSTAPWYKRRPPSDDQKVESELNKIERKNVAFLYEYEKKMGWR